MSLETISATCPSTPEAILVLHIEDDLDDAFLLKIFAGKEYIHPICLVHTPSLSQALALYKSLQKQLEIKGGYQKAPILVVDFNFGREDSRETVADIREYERASNLTRARSILFSSLDPASFDLSYESLKDLHDFYISKDEKDSYKKVSRKIVGLYQNFRHLSQLQNLP